MEEIEYELALIWEMILGDKHSCTWGTSSKTPRVALTKSTGSFHWYTTTSNPSTNVGTTSSVEDDSNSGLWMLQVLQFFQFQLQMFGYLSNYLSNSKNF